MKNSNQKGFSAVEIVIVLVVLGLLGLAGWFVYGSMHKDSKASTTASSTNTTPSTTSDASKRKILSPQTKPPVVDECTTKLETAQDGNSSPIGCPESGVNVSAWNALKGASVMALPSNATIDQVVQAMCKDIKNSTGPIEDSAENFVDNYNGWNYHNDSKIVGFMGNLDTVCK